MFRGKSFKQILTLAFVPFALLATTTTIHAKDVEIDTKDESEFIVEVGIDRSKENPLTIKLGDDLGFIIKDNMIPGDTIHKKIVFTNVLSETIEVNLESIVDMINEPSNYPLINVLDLTLSADGMKIFDGKLSETTDPVLTWMEVGGNDKLEIDVDIEFPLMSDNRYQDGKVETKWVFSTRADVPDDPDEEDEDDVEYIEVPNPELQEGEAGHNPEDVDTSDIFKNQVPVTAILVVGTLAVALVLSKKKK